MEIKSDQKNEEDQLKLDITRELTLLTTDAIEYSDNSIWGTYAFKHIFQGNRLDDIMTGKQVLTDFGDNIQYEPHTLKQEHVKDDDIFVKAGQIRKLIENYMNNYVSNKYLQTNTYSKTYKLGLKLKTNDINKRDMFYIKLRETLEVLCDAIGTGDHSHQSKKKTSKLEDDSMSHLAPAIGRMPMHLNNSSGSVYNHPGMSAAAAAAGMMSHQPPPSPLLYNQMNQMMYRNPNMMNMPMSMPLQASMQMPRPGTMPMNMRQMPIGSNTSSVASMMPSRDQQLAALFNANGGNPMNAISNASATAGSSSSINNNNNNSSKVKEIEMNFVRMCSEVSDMKKEMLCLQSELNMYKSHYTKAQQHAGAATAGDEGVDFDSPKQSSWLLPVPASVAVVTNNGVTHLTSETSRMAKYIVLIPKQNRQQIRQDATHGDSNKDSLTADLMALLKTVSVQSSSGSVVGDCFLSINNKGDISVRHEIDPKSAQPQLEQQNDDLLAYLQEQTNKNIGMQGF